MNESGQLAPTVLVIFGSGGDLAWRKLVPALFSLYRDRGLPDLRIASVFPSKIVGGGYMVTVTVENLGGAAAEVPVTLHMATGEATERLVVPGRSKASVRILAAGAPITATVNDGSVPESDMTNNTYKIESLDH